MGLSAALETVDLVHRYGSVEALGGVSLSVAPGAFFALLGPNGGGKTTLLRIVSTLLEPTSGTARVAGHDVRTAPSEVRRALGVVFQSPSLDEALTVAENLRVQGALYGLRGAALGERIAGLLAAFDLDEHAARRVRDLSGGLRRRADLARGLLHRPAVLILDEPTAALDPAARHAFWAALEAARRDEGVTVVAATHLLDEAERADHIAVLDRGMIVAEGAPDALRAALGRETLWLELAPGADASALAADLATTGLTADALTATLVRVRAPEPHRLLADLYARYGDRLHGATVRRASLEDVFLTATGRRLDDA